MQADGVGGTTRIYKSFPHAIGSIIRNEGLLAVYKGIGATTYRQASSAAIRFYCFSIFKKQLEDFQGKVAPWHAFVAGAGGGAVSAIVNNPVDVVKTTMQRQVTVPGQPLKYQNMFQCAVTLLKEEGVSICFRGMVPRIARIVPGQAVVFGVHQFAYDALVAWRS
jgi:solute carrier family 25 citrate transporter 1